MQMITAVAPPELAQHCNIVKGNFNILLSVIACFILAFKIKHRVVDAVLAFIS